MLQAKADQFRYLLDSYGLQSKFLANTEVALICGREGVYEPACETTAFENTKAIYLVQAYALAYTRNLRINSWYMYFGWRNSDLKNQDTLVYLPAFYSYQFVGQLWANVNSGKGSISGQRHQSRRVELGIRQVLGCLVVQRYDALGQPASRNNGRVEVECLFQPL